MFSLHCRLRYRVWFQLAAALWTGIIYLGVYVIVLCNGQELTIQTDHRIHESIRGQHVVGQLSGSMGIQT